jgi:RNA polymerase sigma factor (TIGR02999 family)
MALSQRVCPACLITQIPAKNLFAESSELPNLHNAMSDVTGILQAIGQGDPKAGELLLPIVYDELRKLAASKIAQENPGQTLQATALVHEAWLRLAPSRQQWRDRKHFFGAAAEAMRRVLIDQVRRKASLKRGENQPLQAFHESQIELCAPSDEILAVNEALDALAREDALAADVVKLRYFVGMSVEEIAEAYDVSARTVNRHWEFARAWLKQAIAQDLKN